jgi:dihydrofolate reductase
MPPLALVAAVARNGVIGGDNRLLWRLKTDLRRFRDLTLGLPVVMGRRTFESIGKPLPGRRNIVLTRDPALSLAGVSVARELGEALSLAAHLVPADRADGAIMVIGGADLYAQTIGLASRLHVTEVELSPAGDALFPLIDRALWRETRRERHAAGPDDEAPFSFVDYLRRDDPLAGGGPQPR